jgi:hypothetical protein
VMTKAAAARRISRMTIGCSGTRCGLTHHVGAGGRRLDPRGAPQRPAPPVRTTLGPPASA